MLNYEEDIRQDILLRLITPSPSVQTNYLERFDPEKNSLEGFISRFVFNYFCRLYARHRHPVETAEPIEVALLTPKSDSFAIPPVVRDGVYAEHIVEELDILYPFTSGVVYRPPLAIPPNIQGVIMVSASISLKDNETILWRSVSNIFRLMLDGYSQEEVATVMAVSKGWVSKQVHKVRTLPEVADWATEYGLAAQT